MWTARVAVGMDAPAQHDRSIWFGDVELDVRSRELRRGDTRVRLQEQPFEILRLMLERPGDVVTREDLSRRLWPEGTFVDFEHSLNAAVKRLRAALGDDADAPTFVETVPRRGYRLIAPVRPSVPDGVPAYAHAARVVVLPFTNLSRDPSQQYFSDGMTEELIAQLGHLCGRRIGVIGRWSSMAVRDANRGIREIGQALGAHYALEGSVRREGDRARITARLVETEGETQLWGDTYERHLADGLSVQADVAARIARAMTSEMLPADHAVTVAPTRNAAAYQTYLQGRFFWNLPGDSGLPEAMAAFSEALDYDPSFAAAHAMMARCSMVAAQYYREVPRVALEACQRSAERALEFDGSLAEAHVALADARRFLHWDWAGAESSFLRAIALNPSSESAHHEYGMLLTVLGRHDEARREVDRAFELDPLCLVVSTAFAASRYFAGDYDGVVERCHLTIGRDPLYGFAAARRLLGAAYLAMGRHQEAVRELRAGLERRQDDPVLLSWLAHAAAVSGDRDAAFRCVHEVERLGQHQYIPPYHLSMAHAGLGNLDEAFALLDRACRDRDPVLAQVAVEPRFRSLHDDRRYTDLLMRLGLDAETRRAAAPATRVHEA